MGQNLSTLESRYLLETAFLTSSLHPTPISKIYDRMGQNLFLSIRSSCECYLAISKTCAKKDNETKMPRNESEA